MLELQGKYNKAKVFTDNIDNETISQVIQLLNQPYIADSKLRIMPDCLPYYTEVLTDIGFKPIYEISYHDKIANYDKVTKTIQFAPPKAIIKRPLRTNEKLYQFYLTKNHTSFVTTENHRILINDNVQLAKDIPLTTTMKEYPFCGNNIAPHLKQCHYSDIELQLLCWIIGDSSISDNGCGTIRVKFAFQKTRKIHRLTDLLNQYQIQYHTHVDKKGHTNITINKDSSAKLINLLPNGIKSMPNEILYANSHQFEIIKNEIIQADGNYEAYNQQKGFVYTTTDKHTSDILQALFCINGHLVVQKEKPQCRKQKSLYRINATEAHKIPYNKNGYHNSKITKSEIHYQNDVYCIECDTSFFIIKQHGLTMVTGNCHAGAGCVIGTTMTITDKVCCNLVGVDVGCGMLAVQLKETDIDLPLLDTIINQYVPSGFDKHEHPVAKFKKLETIVAPVDVMSAYRSIGTLGGGEVLATDTVKAVYS